MRIEKRPTSSIIVRDRLREDVGDLTELADSITRLGLMHPIVILDDGTLIAGERRLRVHEKLGLPEIDTHVWAADTPLEDVIAAEYDENETRRQMSAADKERYFQRIMPSEMAKLRERREQDPKFNEALKGTGVAQEAENRVAKRLGTNRTAISSTRKLREVAENPADPAHKAAVEEYEKLQQIGRGSDRAWRRVQKIKQDAEREATLAQTRATLLPGQKLREDQVESRVPKQSRTWSNWTDRLWHEIGVANLNPPMINNLALELEAVSPDIQGAGDMVALLDEQIEARKRLRAALNGYKKKKVTE